MFVSRKGFPVDLGQRVWAVMVSTQIPRIRFQMGIGTFICKVLYLKYIRKCFSNLHMRKISRNENVDSTPESFYHFSLWCLIFSVIG